MVHALRREAGYNMYRRTYISKVLEELSALARRLQALRNEGKQTEAIDALEHFYKSVFPQQGAGIWEETPEYIISQTQLGIAVLEPLAEVLTEEAALLSLQGKPEDIQTREKSPYFAKISGSVGFPYLFSEPERPDSVFGKKIQCKYTGHFRFKIKQQIKINYP
jgi:hypothetical protein